MHPACLNKTTKLPTKELVPSDQILGSKTLVKTGFAQKGASLVAPGGHTISIQTINQSIVLLQPCCEKICKNELKHGPKNGTAWWSHFWGRMPSLGAKQKRSMFTAPFLGPSGGTAKIRKSTVWAHPGTKQKLHLCFVYAANIDMKQRRPARARPEFKRLSGSKNDTFKRARGIDCLCSLAPMCHLRCSTTHAIFTNPSLLSATPILCAMSRHVSSENPNLHDTISKG